MITMKELALYAPAALATKPAAHCSPRYSMLPTIDAIKALEAAGYQMVAARQDNVRPDKWKRELHARHKITLRHETTAGMSKQQRSLACVPEFLLTNSSDASCPFQLDLGVFRLICSNGMVVFSSIDSGSFIHKQVTAAHVLQRVSDLSKRSKPLFDKIELWSRTRMNPLAVQRYAEKALQVRLGALAQNYDWKTIVASKRVEDEAPTLWNVFNRCQENGMKGEVFGAVKLPGGVYRPVHARPLSGIAADNQFNKELWAMTEAFAEKAGVR